jgi:hypothetical protein
MNRFGIGHFRRADDCRRVEVALARRRRSNAHRLVGEANIFRIRIRFRMHGHRLDTELAAGALDSQRDFAAVGYEDFLEHRFIDTILRKLIRSHALR